MKTRPEKQIQRGGAGKSLVEGLPGESQSERYSPARVPDIWAAAALPMTALARVVAP